jgi:hypothetical protein
MQALIELAKKRGVRGEDPRVQFTLGGCVSCGRKNVRLWEADIEHQRQRLATQKAFFGFADAIVEEVRTAAELLTLVAYICLIFAPRTKFSCAQKGSTKPQRTLEEGSMSRSCVCGGSNENCRFCDGLGTIPDRLATAIIAHSHRPELKTIKVTKRIRAAYTSGSSAVGAFHPGRPNTHPPAADRSNRFWRVSITCG